jgi:hypothetical protein
MIKINSQLTLSGEDGGKVGALVLIYFPKILSQYIVLSNRISTCADPIIAMMTCVDHHFHGVVATETKLGDMVAQYLINEIKKIPPGTQLFQTFSHERALMGLTLDEEIFNKLFRHPSMLEHLTLDKSRHWWNNNYYKVSELYS